jgi:4'-phosphopantetheinyl transferase
VISTPPPELAWLSIEELMRLGERRDKDELLSFWLTPTERARYQRFVVPKRQKEWLAGRISAKALVCGRHGLRGRDAFASVEIQSQQDGPQRNRPSYCISGCPGDFDLSLTHSQGLAIAALARKRGQRIGVDLEEVARRGESFEVQALSPQERSYLAPIGGQARWQATTMIWVLKEALSKALGIGLRLPFHGLTVDEELLTRRRGRWLGALRHLRLQGNHVTAELGTFQGLIAGWVTVTPLSTNTEGE